MSVVAATNFAASDTPTYRKARKYLESEVALSRVLQFLVMAPDPDEMLRRAGIRRFQLKQLELDDEVYQCVETRREALVATPWRIESPSVRLTKLMTDLVKPHIEPLMRGVMDARFYGYTVSEIIYKNVGNVVGVDRLTIKPMQWFAPQTDGTLRYFPDDGTGGLLGIECSPIKFILTRCNPTYENPYGEALFSRLYFPIAWRREGWGLWLHFLETFCEPIILGQTADYDGFVDAMLKQGVRSVVAWQSVNENDKITTINSSTPGEFNLLEQAIVRRVQKLILGQTLTSDVGASGSYAVAAIHNEVRNDKRRADIRMVQAAGQKLIDNISLLNGFEPPKFVISDDSGLDISRAQRDAILTNVLKESGYRLSQSYFLSRYDIEDTDLVEAKEIIPNVTRVPVDIPVGEKTDYLPDPATNMPAATKGQSIVDKNK